MNMACGRELLSNFGSHKITQSKIFICISFEYEQTLKGKNIENYVVTFTISTPFEEWAKAYDSSIDSQKEVGITSIYRGLLKDILT